MPTRPSIRPAFALTLALTAVAALAALGACGDTPPGGATSDCPPGSLGCVCASGDTCGTLSNGEALRCMDGACVPMTCAPGTPGCVCRGGVDCDDAGDECKLGICKPVDCAAGTASCDCLLGECGAALYCDLSLGGGTCVDGTGFPGGPCPANGLCHNQSRCDRALDVCVHCELGSQGCAPDRGVCNPGLVYAVGRCYAPDDVPPGAPECYTRCTADVHTEDGVLVCDPEGFLAGCLPGLTCDRGSCVPAGETRPSCSDDNECPDHQRCLADGHCYSNCDSHTDCAPGRSCHDHVCRLPCTASAPPGQGCPASFRCDMEDGQSGYCVPLPAEPPPVPPGSGATYRLSASTVTFTHLEPTATVRIVSESPVAERFTVTRAWHRAYDRQGAQIVDPRAEAEPLWFLGLTSPGATTLPGGGLEVLAGASCGEACPTLSVTRTGALPDGWARFEGAIEITSPTLGVQSLTVTYQAAVDGRWTGTMYYFASFPDVGLAAWRQSGRQNADDVGNALIAQWTAYRNGRLRLAELQAVLNATATGSWAWPSTVAACAGVAPSGACYLFDGAIGVKVYADNRVATPIPTGVTPYPVAINLRADAPDESGHAVFRGTIDSAVALHYGGRPQVELTFAHRPDDLARCAADGVPGDCVTFLADLRADIVVGARQPATNGTCPAGLTLARQPWLVPGFVADTRAGFREECREPTVPYAAGDPRNANLTAGNPVADGRSLRRELRLVDGAMINQQQLLVLFEETVASSLRGPPVTTYGYMLLERSHQPVATEELVTASVGTSTRGVTGPLPGRATCDRALAQAQANLPAGQSLPAGLSDADRATLMLTGRLPGATPPLATGVHYLCVDTGRIDGGAGDTGAPGSVRLACPATSNVRYFVLPPSFTQAAVAALPCQQDGTCGVQLEAWVASSMPVTLDPVWSCADASALTCSANRHDLREGKTFYAPGPAVWVPLHAAIEDAFRYKLQFRAAGDHSVGFAPARCVGSGALTPYCYDAAQIEATADRVDCLLATYAAHTGDWAAEPWAATRAFLTRSLSVVTTGGVETDGFERLHTELLTMLGDDAMARALSSRFDLASANGAGFFGSQFEPGGIDVAGIAGYEMKALYQAVQYYQLTTERFFTKVAPVVFAAIAAGDVGPGHVVSPAMVSTYLERLIGSSAKRAAAWSYIAERYRGFNRADLARSVMQRAYMGTYLESALLSRLMLDLVAANDSTNRDQIVAILDRAQHQYDAALARMREVFERISTAGDRFGFSPDYIPFPALDDNDSRYSNAFEAVLALARMRAETARQFEEDAIQSSRAFETNEAAFQSELVQIRVAKEARLAELCGSFDGNDGRVHPAIRRYAYLSDRTALIGDPCGFVGTGEIHARINELALLKSEIAELRRRIQHIVHRIDLEDQRVAGQCQRLATLRDFQIGEGNRRRTLQVSISEMENTVSLVERAVGYAGQVASMTQCTAIDCAAVPGRIGGYLAAAALGELTIGAIQTDIIDARDQLEVSHLADLRAQLDSECEALQIDVIPVIADLAESMTQLDHDVHQTLLRIKMELDTLTALRLEARRLEQEEADAEQLAIDVEAARSDPNVRVYTNTAMLNADRSFNRALEYAYRATRLLEYYKSASYAHADELYLIRMVTHGEYNLSNYLDELEDDYEAFRAEFHNRSQRAVRLSLANDILRIPTLAEDGRPLSVNERSALLREHLMDPRRLDARGRRTFELRTTLEQFAPCTFGHQINYVEIMLSGANLGDPNASVMLWQDGTGVIQRPDQGQNFHRLPPALVVATPRRDLDTAFEPSVYRNVGMRERPLVNTSWRLVFDELHPQNRDIRFEDLNDIFLYIYYTDFTNPQACR
ncbi:MAG TPA: hypothetical protein VM734_34110 [Kofleriaceae bacterium]|nr:hypothetical protein [Kofleriaceae bacterium]